MKRGADILNDEYINVVIYAPSGVGKTVLVCTAAEHAKKQKAGVLAIDIEGGIKGRLLKGRNNLFILRPEAFSEFNDIYNKLKEHLDGLNKVASMWDNLAQLKAAHKKLTDIHSWITGKEEIEWIPLLHVLTDSFSETQISAMEYIVPNDNMMTLKNPEIQHWGKNINTIRFIIRKFKGLPINTWFTALEKFKKEKDDEGKEKLLGIVPKFAGKDTDEDVCGLVDIVGYYCTKSKGPKEIDRILYFQPINRIKMCKVKDRFDMLGTDLINPSVSTIMELLELDAAQAVITCSEVMQRIVELSTKK